MVKNKTNSRLEETNFSVHNLREAYISSQAEYIASIRDCALFSNWGVNVLVRVPVDKDGNISINNVDEYSNFVDIHWKDTTETVIPKFTSYHEHVTEAMQMDGIDGAYPLEVIIPTKLYLPRNSRIVLTEYDALENKVAREWVVLSTQIKQLSNSKTYSQIANCVPARKESFNNADTIYSGEFWFDHNILKDIIKTRLQAQGIIWFLKSAVNENQVMKYYTNDIYEQNDDYPIYIENVEDLFTYPALSSQILEAGKGFKAGEYITLKYDNDEEILISDKNHTEQPLKLYIHDVDENGGITEFMLSVNNGYSKFPENFVVTVKNNISEAKVKLESIVCIDSIYQETLDVSEIEKPKYIYPEKCVSVFNSKAVAVSVFI